VAELAPLRRVQLRATGRARRIRDNKPQQQLAPEQRSHRAGRQHRPLQLAAELLVPDRNHRKRGASRASRSKALAQESSAHQRRSRAARPIKPIQTVTTLTTQAVRKGPQWPARPRRTRSSDFTPRADARRFFPFQQAQGTYQQATQHTTKKAARRESENCTLRFPTAVLLSDPAPQITAKFSHGRGSNHSITIKRHRDTRN